LLLEFPFEFPLEFPPDFPLVFPELLPATLLFPLPLLFFFCSSVSVSVIAAFSSASFSDSLPDVPSSAGAGVSAGRASPLAFLFD
jgi:hypothetical protein